MSKIVLISGYKRSGKDFVANLLAEQLRSCYKTVEILSFATPLKQVVASTFDITLKQLEDYKNAEDDILCHIDNAKIHHNLHTISMRKILQRFGTEAARPVFGNNVWSNLMNEKIKTSAKDVIIIPDYRFDEEFKSIAANGVNPLVLRVDNKNYVPKDEHASEVLPTEGSTYIVDNTDKDDGIVDQIQAYTYYLLDEHLCMN